MVQKDKFQCKQCGKYVLGNRDLPRYNSENTGLKEFVCSSCEKSNTSIRNLKFHVVKSQSTARNSVDVFCNRVEQVND